VEQLSEITPRMFAVEFNRPSGHLSFTVVLLALSSNHALAQALWMFPGFRRTCFECHVQDVAFVDINWEIGMAFVAKRMSRPAMLLTTADRRRQSAIGAQT